MSTVKDRKLALQLIGPPDGAPLGSWAAAALENIATHAPKFKKTPKVVSTAAMTVGYALLGFRECLPIVSATATQTAAFGKLRSAVSDLYDVGAAYDEFEASEYTKAAGIKYIRKLAAAVARNEKLLDQAKVSISGMDDGKGYQDMSTGRVLYDASHRLEGELYCKGDTVDLNEYYFAK